LNSSVLYTAGTYSYSLPSSIPTTAEEVQVLAYCWKGAGGTNDGFVTFSVWTASGSDTYKQYLITAAYPNTTSITVNSDNLWFPYTSERRVWVSLDKTFSIANGGVNAGCFVKATGWR